MRMAKISFSRELESWLTSKQPKTVKSLGSIFEEKSFAISFLLLMIFPALPIPTGGVSHIFEIITMLLALEMVWGRKTIWLPKRWQNLRVRGITRPKVSARIIKYVNKAERFARPRYSHIFSNQWFGRLFGLLVFIFTLLAFLPIPFIGLDTLPAMGVVLLSLSFIFEDSLLFALGIVAGLAGVLVDITIGAGAFRALNHLL